MTWMMRPDYGLILAQGEDAREFLQGQLTNDTRQVAPDRAVRAAYLTPQGRALALLTVLPQENGALLVLPAALVEPVLKRLKMFVLRSRVTLQAVDSEGRLACSDRLPDRAHQRDQVMKSDGSLTWIASLAPALAWRLQAAGSETGALPYDPDRARLWQIQAGLPEVDAASSGQYLPQMLNLDRLDGISFRKGCYTGQEIVARTQHLGRIKRRLFRIAGSGDCPASGATVHRDESGIGSVLLAAPEGAGYQALVVLQLEGAASGDPLSVGGRIVTLQPLPYALEEPA